jgi:enoyl-CoA hydratase/carnithine racemase
MDNGRPMTGDAAVQFKRHGAVGIIALHNPRRLNALTLSMWRELAEVLSRARDDEGVKVLVLRGSGEAAFCAGADISEFDALRAGDASKAYNEANHAAFQALRECPKPTIAMIFGPCLGGGFQLAASCDLRLASTDAVFGIPAARLGLGYNPQWIATLVAALGASAVKEMFFTASRFDVDWAMRNGFLRKVVPARELDAEVAALAETIAQNAPLTMRAAKAAIDAQSAALGDENRAALAALADACFASEDYAEGRRAFAEKRKPQFTGR